MDSGRKAYMAYVAEGLGDIIQDWDEVLTYQSKNGSLFNSPSATSALAIHSGDNNALKYLDELGNKFFSSGVCPTMFFSRLHGRRSSFRIDIVISVQEVLVFVDTVLLCRVLKWLHNDCGLIKSSLKNPN